MPHCESFNFKSETLRCHRQQTRDLLTEIAVADSWFYTGATDRHQAKHLYDFLKDVPDQSWLLFTECNWTRDRAHKMFATVVGQDYAG